MKKQSQQGGFVRFIIILIIAILLLSYFNIDLKTEVEKPQTQQNITYVKDQSQSVWQQYLEQPFFYIWNNIFIDLIWSVFVDNMERIKNHVPTTIEQQGMQVAAPFANIPVGPQSQPQPIQQQPQPTQQTIPHDNY